jgi:hypothetical protein
MENTPITITMTVNHCNIVLNALAARPYGEVAELVVLIKEQGEKAVAELQAPTEPQGT